MSRLTDEQVAEALERAKALAPHGGLVARAHVQVSADLSAAKDIGKRVADVDAALARASAAEDALSAAKGVAQTELARAVAAELALEALQEKARELEGYRERYAAILERCRKTVGPCFCGVHISDVMGEEVK